MQIVDSQIHLWENARMSPQHRQIPTYSMDDDLQEMAAAGVDAAVIHPPSTLGEAMNELASEPAWYNALTTNCTTTIRQRVMHAGGNMPLSWKLIAIAEKNG